MKIKEVIKKRKKEAVLGTVFVFLVVVALWQAVVWRSSGGTPAPPKASDVSEVRRLLDGVWVATDLENPPIAGVMVENMIEAQPISGVADARLVFEAITEANITRFLAYFILPSPQPSPAGRGELNGHPLSLEEGQGEDAIEIGPVRSARPYYLDWASEFNTLYAHVGSSPAAYEMLRKQGVEGAHDLDQWYAPEYFYFKNGRPRSHHIYTTTELLGKAYETVFTPSNSPSKRGRNETISSPFEGEVRRGLSPWRFKSDAPPDLRGQVTDISISYGEPYAVRWLYDKSENHYKRMQWARPTFASETSVGQGGVHTMADGKEIIAKNIAVAFQKMKVLDEVGRKEFTTLGEGKGLVFQDGKVVVGLWRKSNARERMRFYNAQGDEVEFNAGVNWVEIVPDGYQISY